MTTFELGDWRPSASRLAIETRAQLLANIRGFFSARKVLEVETAMMGRLLGIDAFDQPGVEEGKKRARELMGG